MQIQKKLLDIFSNLDVFDKLLITLCSFHLFGNILWIILSTAPLPWDQAGHTRTAILFAEFFKSLDLLNIRRFMAISSYYPPLIHIVISFLILVFGNPVFVSGVVISLFYIVSILLLYLYCFGLFKRKDVAFFSAVIFSFLPIVYEHSRWFMLELPGMAFLLSSLLFLHKSDTFANKRYTRLFFLTAALSLMTKWLALVYLLIPIALTFRRWFTLSGEYRMRSSYHILWGVCVLIAITLPWYLFNTSNIIGQLPANIKGESSDPQAIFSLANFVFYLYIFINFQLTFFPAILFFISLVFFVVSRNSYRLLFLLYIAFIYTVFTIIPNKDWRYTMPVLPFVCMIIGLFLGRLWQIKKSVGEIVVILFVGFLFVYYLLLSFRYPVNFTYQKAVNIPMIGWIDYVNVNDNLAHAYNTETWPQKEILTKILKDRTYNFSWVLVLIDQERFNPGNLLLERDMQALTSVEANGPPDSLFANRDDLVNYLSYYHYAIVAEKKVGVEATRNLTVFNQLKEAIETDVSIAQGVDRYLLPNGDYAVLYRLTAARKKEK